MMQPFKINELCNVSIAFIVVEMETYVKLIFFQVET